MKFADALIETARGRQRVKRTEIWQAFNVAHPVEAAAGDARERLVVRLRALASIGRITLPSEKGSAWDRTVRPAIPEWVAFAKPVLPEPTLDVMSVPWAPELAFVPTTPGLDLEAALAVQTFLANGGRERPQVPMRERSVQLFGDEKRLDRLVRTPLFGDGRLSLAVLRCFAMAPPLVFDEGPDGTRGRPCLVIENHHTWWSFCQWNRRVGEYSAVVYGAGGGFGRGAVAFLDERCRTWNTATVEYFGDLDRDGLVIPWRAATQYAAGSIFQLVPSTRWYTLLLARATTVDLPSGAALDVEADALAWLDDLHRTPVSALLAKGVRVPQELVGLEQLELQAATALEADLPF